jgi:hypothetical protein
MDLFERQTAYAFGERNKEQSQGGEPSRTIIRVFFTPFDAGMGLVN